MMTSTERGGRLADAVALLVAERDDLARRLADATERERDIARRMYRRGYSAGHHAAHRGQSAVTNPERHARTDLRQILAEGGEVPDLMANLKRSLEDTIGQKREQA